MPFEASLVSLRRVLIKLLVVWYEIILIAKYGFSPNEHNPIPINSYSYFIFLLSKSTCDYTVQHITAWNIHGLVSKLSLKIVIAFFC